MSQVSNLPCQGVRNRPFLPIVLLIVISLFHFFLILYLLPCV